MSENKTPKPSKSQTFDYGNPLRSSTFDSDPLKSESVIAVRPLSTSEYNRFRPIAKAYNLPVPEVKLNVIRGANQQKTTKATKKQVAPDPEPKTDSTAPTAAPRGNRTLVVKVPNSSQEPESSAREHSVTDIFASMIKPQKTAIDLKVNNEKGNQINETDENQSAKTDRKSYRQRKKELLGMDINIEKNEEPKEKKIKSKKSKKTLEKSSSQQSLVNETIQNDFNDSLLIDETTFTKPNPVSLSSLSFNSKSARFSFEADEMTKNQTNEVSILLGNKRDFSMLSSRSINDEKAAKKRDKSEEQQKTARSVNEKKIETNRTNYEEKIVNVEDLGSKKNETETAAERKERKKEKKRKEKKEEKKKLREKKETEENAIEIKNEVLVDKPEEPKPIEIIPIVAEIVIVKEKEEIIEKSNIIEVEPKVQEQIITENNQKTAVNISDEQPQNEKPEKELEEEENEEVEEVEEEDEEDDDQRDDNHQEETKMNQSVNQLKPEVIKKKPKKKKIKSIKKKDFIKENKKTIKSESKKNKSNRLLNDSSLSAHSTVVDEINETSLSNFNKYRPAKNKSSFSITSENLPSGRNTARTEAINEENEKLGENYDTKTISSRAPSPPPPSQTISDTNLYSMGNDKEELYNPKKDVKEKDIKPLNGIRKSNKKKCKCTKNQWCLIITGLAIIFLIILFIIILVLALRGRSNIARLEAPAFTNYTDNTTTTSTTSTTTTTTTSTTTTSTTTTALTCIVTTKASKTQIISNSYSCPNNSPYVPKFLTTTDSYSYGYPIFQQVVCMDSILSLICPSNQYIHIYSAYFGIQSQTITTCLSIGTSTPTNCFNKAVFNTINSTCEYNSNCSIIATVSHLGDPCFANSKQLVVQYQCLDYNATVALNKCPINTNTSTACPAQNDSSILTQSWCEPSLMQIQCTSPNVIQIVCAYYGIDSSYQCAGGNYIGAPTSCYSSSSKQLVMTKCNGKTSCQILGNPSYQSSGFTDSCYGFSKLLYVQYKCVSKTTTEVTTTTTTEQSTTSTLPFCQNTIFSTGSCSSTATSPYVPTFLTANQTSFGYPIMQQLVCLGSSINLICPVDTFIHIYSAYFGIQSKTSVPSCFLTTSEQPAMCYNTNSFSYINSTCEYEQSCLISADSSILGDTCPNYVQKQLLIQYQCIDSYAINTTGISINSCNPTDSTVPLICPLINITNTINANVTNTNITSSNITFSNRTTTKVTTKSTTTKSTSTTTKQTTTSTTSTKLMNYTMTNSSVSNSSVSNSSIAPTIITSQQTWCDGSKMNITCKKNQTITILCAFYGLHPSLGSSCNISSLMSNIPVCYFESSFTLLSSLCSTKTTCAINNLASYFDDPCDGQNKALFVQWTCSE